MTADTCPATAASCSCSKPAGHVEAGDPVHECPPDECTGAWTGELDSSTFPSRPFHVVRWPRKVRR